LTQEVEHLRTGKRWGRAAAVHPSYSEFYQASAYAGFQHEIRPAGSLGVQLMYVRQDGHELTDCATPDLLIGIRKRITASPARYDLGDGWIDIPSDRPHTVAAPPLTDIGYRIEGPSELIIVAAPAHRLAGALDSPALIERLAPVYEKPFADPLHDVLGTRAWIEAERDDGLFVDSAVVAMLSLMLSASDTIRKTSPGVAPPADLRFNRVIDYIDAHLAEDISLTDLAATACLSPFHFTRAFKARHGVSPVRFVQRRRVERAMRLLSKPDARLIEIAHQCGFADQAHFTTAFRRVTGFAPGAWRTERLR